MGLALLVLRAPELTEALRTPVIERLMIRSTSPSTSPGEP
jgi:hypothetical protein